MFTEHQIEQYRQDGFIKGKRILSEPQIEELCAELDRVIEDQGSSDKPQPIRVADLGQPGNPVWQIVNIWQASPAFEKILSIPALQTALAQLTGTRDLRLWHDQIQYKPAGTGGPNWWHQDGAYWPVLKSCDREITAWIALDDAAEDNGCMSMVPGSHLWGRDRIPFLKGFMEKGFHGMPTRLEDHELTQRPCPVAPGEVHFHHIHTWHGSPANTSGRKRRAVAFHFFTPETRYHAGGNHLLKPHITSQNGDPVQGPIFRKLG